MKRIPVILDGDPGHDDAMAWMVAAASPMLDIKAVTTVAGNKDIENVTTNTLNVCSLFGIHAPVGKGAHGPLVVEGITAGDFHGKTGLDGADLPPSDRTLSQYSAVELMVRVLEESEEPVVIIGTGAQTNLATLLLYRPDLKEKIEAFYIMGGGIETGNWTPAAEFNILVDPEAARIVFESGVPVVMSGLDVTEKALVYPEDVKRIRSIGTPMGDIVSGWLDFFGETHAAMGYEGWPLHDPCAVLSLIKPEIFIIKDAHLQVETKGLHTRGQVLADFEDQERFNGKAVLDLDREAFIDELIKAVEHFNGREELI
ncbi:nucleoside hydrolase [Gudongella sp. SC589]|uniref:nucleoside hydrolase n=1 Tax=Gudongella sp. SC589 TaxID=3385990 RepID=UPI0039049877